MVYLHPLQGQPLFTKAEVVVVVIPHLQTVLEVPVVGVMEQMLQMVIQEPMD